MSVRCNMLDLVLEVPELTFGNFKPVSLETATDQLASTAQHSIVDVIVAVAIQTWCNPNPISFLISCFPGIHAENHTSMQNQSQQRNPVRSRLF